MNYKEIIEDFLKTKSKSKLCNELGISQYCLDKILQGEEVPDRVKTKIVNMVSCETEDEEVISISKTEEDFILDAPIDTFPDKVNRISYLNYVLNSTKANKNHYWRQVLTKNGSNTEEETVDQLERMVNAILKGNWKVTEEDVPYMIKLPSHHYLTKMVDGSTGWSLVQNSNTVVGSSKEELLKQYPEYEDFIVQEPLNVVSFKPQGEKNKKFTPSRKKGFVIRDARKIINYALIFGFLLLTLCCYATVTSQKAQIESLEYKVEKLNGELKQSHEELNSKVYSLDMRFKDMVYYLENGVSRGG